MFVVSRTRKGSLVHVGELELLGLHHLLDGVGSISSITVMNSLNLEFSWSLWVSLDSSADFEDGIVVSSGGSSDIIGSLFGPLSSESFDFSVQCIVECSYLIVESFLKFLFFFTVFSNGIVSELSFSCLIKWVFLVQVIEFCLLSNLLFSSSLD